MPAPIIKSLAARSGTTSRHVERVWSVVRDSIAESRPDMADNYGYIVASVKRALKIDSGCQSCSAPEPRQSRIRLHYNVGEIGRPDALCGKPLTRKHSALLTQVPDSIMVKARICTACDKRLNYTRYADPWRGASVVWGVAV